MSFFGDVGSFESFNFGKMFQQLGENPTRALYGSADPFSTSMWNGILGTDDKPLVDQWGGAAPQRYQEAQDAGINTGPGASMHGIARSIASIYAGGAAGNALGGAGSAGGAAGDGGSAIAGGGMSDGAASGLLGEASGTGAATGQGAGILSSIKNGYAQVKPYADAAQTGMKVSSMLQGQPEQPLPPPQLTPITSNQELSGILAQMQQKNAMNTQEAQQRRMQRRSLIGGA